MRYFISAILLSVMLTVCYAQQAPQVNNVNNMADYAKLTLRASPSDDAKVVDKVTPWRQLIPIYKKRNWLKVGDPKNGKVGWINLQQYYKVIADMQKSLSDSIFIAAAGDPNQQSDYDIIVYKDGKKLDKKEAAVVLQQMIKRQVHMQKKFMAMQQQMNNMFMQTMSDFDDLGVISPWLSLTRDRVVAPVVIFMRPSASSASPKNGKEGGEQNRVTAGKKN